jgi:hypothetical protein
VTLDDVVRRRTTLGIRGLDTEGVRARISSLLASSEAEPVACADNRLPDVDWP